ncbi:hypothetical protein CGRA01v4_02334 [Colletotrichum graminicola]|nr:hypothetical protein CGRA01v4_02334 [Colletotrichum graminicola]
MVTKSKFAEASLTVLGQLWKAV